MDAIIVLSDDEEETIEQVNSLNKHVAQKRKAVEPSPSKESKKIRRLAPIKIAEVDNNNFCRPGPSTSAGTSGGGAADLEEIEAALDLSLILPDELPEIDLLVPQENPLDLTNSDQAGGSAEAGGAKNGHKPQKPIREEKTEINETFQALLDACKKADPTDDMEKLINKRLIKYYQSVHPDFVNSKSFIKDVKATTAEIEKQPATVYIQIKHILEELNVRRKCSQTVVTNEEAMVNGQVDEKKERQLKKLNKALWTLKKRIQKLEESDMDLINGDEATSDYLRADRYKKRACQIYEKICDLTGESKNAQRITKKPITFKGSHLEKFNQMLQKFVNKAIGNKKDEFPEYYDVLRILNHCCQTCNLKLSEDEKQKIAEDAFIKLGKALQKRRQTDLYETAVFYVGTEKNPEELDKNLKSKLDGNKKLFHKNINDLIDKFAEEQEKIKEAPEIDGEVSSTSKNDSAAAKVVAKKEPDSKIKETSPEIKEEDQKSLLKEETDIIEETTIETTIEIKPDVIEEPEENFNMEDIIEEDVICI